ncbi:FAD/NAD(P)-binding protein [Sphingobium sp.]|uniref:FAD/NAD(P)-binding protein n=1 Tax=Sphingobium sp. TaxID=1912891 RepID=UPI002CF9D8F5|nr:FAD/NAD(P)-binding protein [Sphingobium sp.]HUD92579.1 FAD/NAD(P)-binding protein [Sphingobium sp.]
MLPSIAFVGAGPTTIYTLHALLEQARTPFDLTIFERQGSVGKGTPYRPGWNDPAMLSNIASGEIPPLEESLFDWLSRQPPERLGKLRIAPADIDERTFYPRVALGEYFYDQFRLLLARAEQAGATVTVRTHSLVTDAVAGADGMRLIFKNRRGELVEETFDHVVLATGHQWPAEPEVRPGYFLSPWPASALAQVPACSIGIRGSSLSAIDAAVALAVTHGAFVEDAAGGLSYDASPGADAFHMTMLSRKGLLPEADFYFPIPYEPLSFCTAEAVEALVSAEVDDLLDRSFSLFKKELAAADPDYARAVALEDADMETFCDRYFAQRIESDPFAWAKLNLAEAERNYARHHTVAWRYAILRMHEVIELLVPHLNDEDFERFSRLLKPVFVDDYATVPHESIRRMLALHEAGKLDVRAVGEDYRIDSHKPQAGAVLDVGAETIHFPVFIEATGQRALAAKDFPFPSLREQGIVRDVPQTGKSGPRRGIVIDDEFHPVSPDIPADQLFCLSLPFLMGRHPFVQGITSAHAMGQVVGGELAAAIGACRARNPSLRSAEQGLALS